MNENLNGQDDAPVLDGPGYEASNIKALKGVDHVRHRPSMYIGNTGLSGLHHLIYEVVDNSIDEAMQGHGKRIEVKLNLDGSATISDDGRGIPVGMHKEHQVSTLQVVLCDLFSSGKFDKDSYKVSGGLHGVGVTVVNALSEWLICDVRRDGKLYRLERRKGNPVAPVAEVGEAAGSGTKISFKPDVAIFPDAKFRFATLESRLRDLAFLNPGVKIILSDEESGQRDEFFSEKGLIDFIKYLS